jgi:L-ascorbate metabolism protein UlaG (beta-lactamase superfamily)
MQIKRLFWAGLAVTVGETTVLVDPLTKRSDLIGRTVPGEQIYTRGADAAQFAFITHRHADHYHPATLRESLNSAGRVVCHQPLAHQVTQDGFSVVAVEREVRCVLGEVQATAVPAVDGFGDDQVSWIIEGHGKRIIHCGDTLWHGYWWRISQQYGPIDLAFLPINGVLMSDPGTILGRSDLHLTDSTIPASLTPEQAVAAGIILGAKAVCPIHYGLDAPLYREYPQAAQCFATHAHNRGLAVLWLQPGEEVQWEQV